MFSSAVRESTVAQLREICDPESLLINILHGWLQLSLPRQSQELQQSA